MNSLGWALLLKPLLLLLMLSPWFFLVKAIEWLRPKLPNHPVLNFLFKERGQPMASFLEPQQNSQKK